MPYLGSPVMPYLGASAVVSALHCCRTLAKKRLGIQDVPWYAWYAIGCGCAVGIVLCNRTSGGLDLRRSASVLRKHRLLWIMDMHYGCECWPSSG